jgi:Disulphide bond corrector protein DsbC
MKYKLLLGILFIFIASVLASAQSVDVSGSGGPLKRGAAGKGVVTLNIEGGYHVNSSRPSGENLIATAVSVTSKDVKVGRVSSPAGRSKKFSFSDKPLSVYEGRVSFPFTVSVPAAFKGNTARFHIVVRYQACNNEACFAPKTKDITITAAVR